MWILLYHLLPWKFCNFLILGYIQAQIKAPKPFFAAPHFLLILFIYLFIYLSSICAHTTKYYRECILYPLDLLIARKIWLQFEDKEDSYFGHMYQVESDPNLSGLSYNVSWYWGNESDPPQLGQFCLMTVSELKHHYVSCHSNIQNCTVAQKCTLEFFMDLIFSWIWFFHGLHFA